MTALPTLQTKTTIYWREEEGDLFDAPWPGMCSVAGVVIQVPGNPDPDEVVRTGELEFVCPACGQTHIWTFRR